MSDQRQTGSTRPTSDAEGASLALKTLGAAALLSAAPAGQRTAVFAASKPLALIVYLASVPGGSATREFLIDLLWADLDPVAGRHAFRQTLWYVKQKTGRPLIRATADTVSLAEAIPSDRADFLRAVEQRDFETAVALYHGDFLPDFASPGGLQFEQWADLERQRLRDTFTRAAEHVIRHWLTMARHRDAVALARRARDIDSLSEKAWRLLLESLVSANDAIGTSLEADALTKMLADEERQPEPATRSMLRTARQLASEPAADRSTGSAIVAELVGREAEFSTLLAAWDEAKSGTACKVSIIGAAGIGKTRLLTDLVARLRATRATRARTVWVRANPGEREIAYSLLSKLAAAVAALPGAAAVSPESAGALVALNPTLSASFSAAPDRSAGPEALRRRTIAMHELLAAAADEGPIAVIVDDLHWADRESARAFTGVAESLERESVLLISAARPSANAAGSASRDASVVRLSPLTAADTGALLASIGSLPDAPIAQRLPLLVRDAAEGVPLLVLETLQFLMDQTLLALDENAWAVRDERGLVQALNAGGALRRRIETLDPMERSALNALALTGVPAPAGFVGDVIARPLPDVAAILHSLELRGMVNHVGDGWEPVHDQIGELAAGGLDPETRRATELAIGRAWLHHDPDDPALRRAGMHFLRGGDRRALSQVFATWARRARRAGDHRSAPALAAEFIESADEEQIRQLARGLPFQFRYASSRWRTAAVVVFAALASAAATWQWAREPAAPPDEQFLAVAVDSTNDTTIYRVGIRRDQWTGGDLLVVPQVGRRVGLTLPSSLTEYTVTRDGKSWISYAAMPDSGGIDLVLESKAGKLQQLTYAPGDDQYADIAPDGSEIVFPTGRFDSLSHAHLAIMDLATHRVRQVTGGSNKEGQPKWSPSGVRIAYGYLSLSNSPDSVCTISPDGSGRRCFGMGPDPLVTGWVDDDRVAVTVARDSLVALEVLDVRDGSMRRIQQMGAAVYRLSPDGQWMYCQCRDVGAAHAVPIVFPVDHPESAQPVVMSALDTRPPELLWPSPRPARYVNTLTTSLPMRGVPMGVAYRVVTFGNTVDGRRMVLPWVSLTSLDTAVLRTAAGSRIIPMAPGAARLVISAGGWRTDTVAVRVVSSRDSTVLRDDWSRGIVPEFVPFGDPQPTVVRDASGRPAFWTNGDGNFFSGAYSGRTFDATDGLGIETTLAIPTTQSQWQWEGLALRPMQDSAALARWNHRDDYPPFDSWSVAGVCAANYPGVEGSRGIHTLSVSGLTIDPDTIFHPPLHDGHLFRIRLQLFPDGRCGVAIDGRPIAISNASQSPISRYFAVIEGQSVRTRVLTGPIDIWTGIRPGIDWLAFDTTRARPRHPTP